MTSPNVATDLYQKAIKLAGEANHVHAEALITLISGVFSKSFDEVVADIGALAESALIDEAIPPDACRQVPGQPVPTESLSRP